MALLGGDEAAGTDVGEVGLDLLGDVGDNRLVPLFLVPFQRQHVVGTAHDDLGGKGRLSPPRSDRDDRSCDLDQS